MFIGVYTKKHALWDTGRNKLVTKQVGRNKPVSQPIKKDASQNPPRSTSRIRSHSPSPRAWHPAFDIAPDLTHPTSALATVSFADTSSALCNLWKS
jgi:hypothetical protein